MQAQKERAPLSRIARHAFDVVHGALGEQVGQVAFLGVFSLTQIEVVGAVVAAVGEVIHAT